VVEHVVPHGLHDTLAPAPWNRRVAMK
jgi:hypothetical protein